MDRRNFLSNFLYAGTAALLISSGYTAKAIARGKHHKYQKQHSGNLPLPYTNLEPSAVAEKAYNYYHIGHCAYGVFASILDELKSKIGEPYTSIPSELFIYGKGGIVGWGTVCGTLNGGAAIITLTCKDYEEVINNLFNWYTKTPLPDYIPANSKKYPVSVANSPLCHISVMKWCSVAGKQFKCEILYNSKQRSERCARLTASVARKTVELLNEYHASKLKPVAVKGRYKTKMSCSGCHQT